MLSGASPVSTSNAETAGHCGSVHITEEVDGLEYEIRRYHCFRTQTLFEESFNTSPRSIATAKVSALELNKCCCNTFLIGVVDNSTFVGYDAVSLSIWSRRDNVMYAGNSHYLDMQGSVYPLT